MPGYGHLFHDFLELWEMRQVAVPELILDPRPAEPKEYWSEEWLSSY